MRNIARFKKIWERNSDELKETIEAAEAATENPPLDFYTILSGVDAYFETRFRKENPGKVRWYNPLG